MPAGERADRRVTWNHFFVLPGPELTTPESNRASFREPEPSRCLASAMKISPCMRGSLQSCSGKPHSDKESLPSPAGSSAREARDSIAGSRWLAPGDNSEGNERISMRRRPTRWSPIESGSAGIAAGRYPRRPLDIRRNRACETHVHPACRIGDKKVASRIYIIINVFPTMLAKRAPAGGAERHMPLYGSYRRVAGDPKPGGTSES